MGTWIDGKTIYRKVFTGISANSAVWKYIGEIQNLKQLISLTGTIEQEQENEKIIAIPDPTSYTGVHIDGKQVGVYTSNGKLQGKNVILVAIFTKTTD